MSHQASKVPMALKIPEAHCENEKIGLKGTITPTSIQQNSLTDLSIHKAKILKMGSTQLLPKFPPQKMKKIKKVSVPVRCAVPLTETKSAKEIKLDFNKYEKGMDQFKSKVASNFEF